MQQMSILKVCSQQTGHEAPRTATVAPEGQHEQPSSGALARRRERESWALRGFYAGSINIWFLRQ